MSLALAVLACSLAVTAAAAEPTGTCITGHVPMRIVLPDGTVHPAGPLTLCFERELNPVTEMDEISIAGAPQGVFTGRRARPERPVDRAYIAFHRNDNDDWILLGFVRPSRVPGERGVSIRLTDPDRLDRLVTQGLVERPVSNESVPILASRGRGEEDDRTLRLAAR